MIVKVLSRTFVVFAIALTLACQAESQSSESSESAKPAAQPASQPAADSATETNTEKAPMTQSAETKAKEDNSKYTLADDSNIAWIETSMGDIIIELNAAGAPKTVANFKKLVNQKFYDGLIFHRVIKGFMIQGGGFTQDYKNKGYHEHVATVPFEGDLTHEAGSIAMARVGGDYNSGTCQFYICPARTPSVAGLDHEYAVFGKTIAGLDVVKKIENVPTAPGRIESQMRSGGTAMAQAGDVPVKQVVIKKIRLIERPKGV